MTQLTATDGQVREKAVSIFIRAVTVISVISLALTGCQQKEPDESATTRGGPTVVQIGLTEWAVSVVPSKAKAGDIKFEVKNTGTETHEFVVIATDLELTKLPLGADGSVDEEAQGIKVVDEIEDVEAGTNRSLNVKLDPGNYVLICNVVETKEDGTKEMHYQMGMRAPFEVT